MEKQGYRKVCVLGGAQTYSYFLEKNLVDEIFLTIEPIVFGSGLPMFDTKQELTDFELVDSKKLNEKGSLLLHYKRK